MLIPALKGRSTLKDLNTFKLLALVYITYGTYADAIITKSSTFLQIKLFF